MRNSVLFVVGALAILGLGGCKVTSYKQHKILGHGSLIHEFCADKGGFVQVNIDSCSLPGATFMGTLAVQFPDTETDGGVLGGQYIETKTVGDGLQVRFDRDATPGSCGQVIIANINDVGAVTCNFNIYTDL